MENNYENNFCEITTNRRTRIQKTDPDLCPICGVTIRNKNEMEQHYALEIERLNKINKKLSSPATASTSSPKNGESSKSGSSQTQEADDCWGTYQKVKNNRQSRLKVKSRKRKAEEVVCPVCNKKTSEDISVHVDMCIRKSENRSNGTSDDSDIDVDGESYEWAGETRVRVSTLLPGGNYNTTGIGTVVKNVPEDEDDELNVDGDDTQIYGASQYSERDVRLINDEKSHLRNLVIGDDPGHTSRNRSTSDHEENNDNEIIREENNQNIANNVSPSLKLELENKLVSPADSPDSANQVIESLKEKIREYENFIKNKPKCLICLDDYKEPVVSICCWHVYCENCWLFSLGARKLCPQCNMITSPTDLRRIYL